MQIDLGELQPQLIKTQGETDKIMIQIAAMGHEVGYHYEDLGATAKSYIGVKAEEELIRIAINCFAKNLEKFRKIVKVKTICMHGSPMNRWDSRLLWKYDDYHKFGIIGEPYFDIDFSEMLYLTDTGRRWNGGNFSVRDKATEVGSLGGTSYNNWTVKPREGSLINMTLNAIDFQKQYKFISTFDLIKAAEGGILPGKIMMTFHPQRWTVNTIPWMHELIWQNTKNVVKYFIVKINRKY